MSAYDYYFGSLACTLYTSLGLQRANTLLDHLPSGKKRLCWTPERSVLLMENDSRVGIKGLSQTEDKCYDM